MNKNDKYRVWKSTNNDIEYEIKKINFKTFEKIVKGDIKVAKREYYFKTFTSYKNNLKKTWITIYEALKKRCNTGKFPTEFIINNKSITDHKEIANQFNNFFSNIGSNLSASIDNTLTFTDYLDDPTEHRFNFSKVTENEIVVIINDIHWSLCIKSWRFSNLSK